jgi:hypothetical protein
MNTTNLKAEYKSKIVNIKKGLIDKNANVNNKIGLIGSDAARLMQIKSLLIEFKQDLIFAYKYQH